MFVDIVWNYCPWLSGVLNGKPAEYKLWEVGYFNDSWSYLIRQIRNRTHIIGTRDCLGVDMRDAWAHHMVSTASYIADVPNDIMRQTVFLIKSVTYRCCL